MANTNDCRVAIEQRLNGSLNILNDIAKEWDRNVKLHPADAMIGDLEYLVSGVYKDAWKRTRRIKRGGAIVREFEGPVP